MLSTFKGAVLFYEDTERARTWYETVGFEYGHGHDGMHWFKLGEGVVMLHPAEKGSGGPEVLVLHAGTNDLDGLFRHVIAKGLRPYDYQNPEADIGEPVTRPWGAREFELLDPEGHRWTFEEVN